MSPPDPFANRYNNLRLVGRGGFGVVYRAWDPQLDREVALKLMNPELVSDPDWRNRFRQEAIAASKLTHPNVTVVFDRGEYEGQPFIVMEFVEGQPLSKIIEQRVPLTDPERLFLIEQLCDGLHYAHQHSIVHRDIKPVNLVVREDHDGTHMVRTLKILDFGIAKVVNASQTAAGGQLMFTPNYVSPEQIKGLEVDARSDIFAVGAVAYELLVGARAFVIETTNPFEFLDEVKRRIVEEPHRPMLELRDDLDPELHEIVNRALEKAPEDRYRDLAEMRRRVQRVRERIEEAQPDLTQSTIVLPPNVQEEFKAARQLLDAGDSDAAIIRLERALELAPNLLVRRFIEQLLEEAQEQLAEKKQPPPAPPQTPSRPQPLPPPPITQPRPPAVTDTVALEQASHLRAQVAIGMAYERFESGDRAGAIAALEAFDDRKRVAAALDRMREASGVLDRETIAAAIAAASAPVEASGAVDEPPSPPVIEKPPPQEALARPLTAISGPARPIEPSAAPTSVTQPPAERRPRRVPLVLKVAPILIALVVLAAFLYTRRAPEVPPALPHNYAEDLSAAQREHSQGRLDEAMKQAMLVYEQASGEPKDGAAKLLADIRTGIASETTAARAKAESMQSSSEAEFVDGDTKLKEAQGITDPATTVRAVGLYREAADLFAKAAAKGMDPAVAVVEAEKELLAGRPLRAVEYLQRPLKGSTAFEPAMTLLNRIRRETRFNTETAKKELKGLATGTQPYKDAEDKMERASGLTSVDDAASQVQTYLEAETLYKAAATEELTRLMSVATDASKSRPLMAVDALQQVLRLDPAYAGANELLAEIRTAARDRATAAKEALKPEAANTPQFKSAEGRMQTANTLTDVDDARRQVQAYNDAEAFYKGAGNELERIAAEEQKRKIAAQEAAKQEAARQETARQEAARQEAARQEAARQEAARLAAAAAAKPAPPKPTPTPPKPTPPTAPPAEDVEGIVRKTIADFVSAYNSMNVSRVRQFKPSFSGYQADLLSTTMIVSNVSVTVAADRHTATVNATVQYRNTYNKRMSMDALNPPSSTTTWRLHRSGDRWFLD